MKKWLLGVALCALASIAVLTGAASAAAAVHVTSTSDEGSGTCTLRGAIEAANNHADAGGCTGVEPSGSQTTIEVPANNYTLTGPLEIKSGANVRIVGTGGGYAVLSGANQNRVMKVASGAIAALVKVEITKGRAHNAPVPTNVYTAYPGESAGGIMNEGTLTLEEALVTENQAGNGTAGLPSEPKTGGGSGSEGGSGGGIYNTGSLAIYRSTISKNLTGVGGNGGPGGEGETPAIGHSPQGLPGGRGGPAGSGGGILNTGSLYIEDSTITENATNRGGEGGSGGRGAGASGGFGGGNGGDGGEGGNSGYQYQKNTGYAEDAERGGGGIYNERGSVTIVDSTISKNNTGAGGNGGPSGPGGANEIGGFQTSGRAGIAGGAGRGGGFMTLGQNASVHLTNVTIYGNFTGQGGNGGGGGGGAANTLGGGAGGVGGDGGGIWSEGSTRGAETVLTNVTIAGNALGAAGLGGASPEPKFVGAPGVRGVGAGIDVGGREEPSGYSIFEKNTIVAGNGNPALGDYNCEQRYRPSYNDFYDLGNNLTFPAGGGENETCLGAVGDPGFGLFGDNGGPTQTLVPSGAAIGIVPLAACTVGEDQRHVARHVAPKTTCDAGAVETTLTGPPTPPGNENPGNETGGGGGGGGGATGGNPPATGGGTTGGGTTPPGGGSGGGSAKASAGAPKVSGTSVSLPVSCTGTVGCGVRVILTVGSGSYAKSKGKGAKPLTVGSASASIAAGAKKTVSVSLNGKGKGLLKKAHKLKATLTVSLSGSSKPVLTKAVTFTGKG
jgi:hypothetical protein